MRTEIKAVKGEMLCKTPSEPKIAKHWELEGEYKA
jgi:hypothetical protein